MQVRTGGAADVVGVRDRLAACTASPTFTVTPLVWIWKYQLVKPPACRRRTALPQFCRLPLGNGVLPGRVGWLGL